MRPFELRHGYTRFCNGLVKRLLLELVHKILLHQSGKNLMDMNIIEASNNKSLLDIAL
jgi:hypothetical protein